MRASRQSLPESRRVPPLPHLAQHMGRPKPRSQHPAKPPLLRASPALSLPPAARDAFDCFRRLPPSLSRAPPAPPAPRPSSAASGSRRESRSMASRASRIELRRMPTCQIGSTHSHLVVQHSGNLSLSATPSHSLRPQASGLITPAFHLVALAFTQTSHTSCLPTTSLVGARPHHRTRTYTQPRPTSQEPRNPNNRLAPLSPRASTRVTPTHTFSTCPAPSSQRGSCESVPPRHGTPRCRRPHARCQASRALRPARRSLCPPRSWETGAAHRVVLHAQSAPAIAGGHTRGRSR